MLKVILPCVIILYDFVMKIKSVKLKQVGLVCLLSLGIFLTPFTSIALAVQESPTPTVYYQGWGTLLPPKDFWDIVASLLVPVSVAWFGWRYKKLEKDREDRWNKEERDREERWKEVERDREERWRTIERDREDQRTKLEQAAFISTFRESLLSEKKKEQRLAINSILFALGDSDAAFVSILQEIVLQQEEESEKTKEQLDDSSRIGFLKNLVSNRYELYHWYRLYEAEKQNKPYNVSRRGSFLFELRNLRSLELLENQEGKTIGSIPRPPKKVDLRDYVKVTNKGEKYIKEREDYRLYNPRKQKNEAFWDSLNQEET